MPLHHAAATNHAAIAKTLLLFGADPDAQNTQASHDTSFTCCTSIADLHAYTSLIQHAPRLGFALPGLERHVLSFSGAHAMQANCDNAGLIIHARPTQVSKKAIFAIYSVKVV